MSAKASAAKPVTVEQARELLLDAVHICAAENVSLDDCLGRVVAKDVISDVDVAAFDRSAMDGFALRAEDIFLARPKYPAALHIIGQIGAGSVFSGTLQQGQALRIMTGAPIPDGADAVAMIEKTKIIGQSKEAPEGTDVCILGPLREGANIRKRGEEARAGEVIVKAGTEVSLSALGLLAATGNTEVSVYRRPRVAVQSTGSELVNAGEVPAPGKIRDSNSYVLAAALHQAGAVATVLPIVKDDLQALVKALQGAVAKHDMVLLSGGASEGDFDFSTLAIEKLGKVVFDRVEMRPGKAQTLGVIDGVPVFGLPGSPGAVALGFEVLIRPVLRKMAGQTRLYRPVVEARLACDVTKRDKRRYYLHARLYRDDKGILRVSPKDNQTTALFSAFEDSDCLLIKPEGGTLLLANQKVRCICTALPEGVVV